MKLCFYIFAILLFIFNKSYADNSKKINTPNLINLWDSKECKSDILSHCLDENHKTNFKLLNCLQKSKEIIKSLSKDCQHFLWDFKLKYLEIDFFNFVTKDQCKLELAKFRSSNQNEIVQSLIKHKSEVTNTICSSLLNEVASIVFSDLIFIHKFLNDCTDNIRTLKCGRLEENLDEFSTENFISRLTSQGNTIECLVDSLDKVNEKCRKQILRLGELQSDDFHLNPKLYFACNDAREKFCSSIEAGQSRIYRCLEMHKSDPEMGQNCRYALNQKHKLEAFDYKIRGYFSHKCASDISKHKCAISANSNEMIELSSIILCLSQLENRKSLNAKCRNELLVTRSQMAKNLELYPDIKNYCAKEIKKYCLNLTSAGDSVIHCLMRNSMPALENQFRKNCTRSIADYIKTVDPTENIEELDPVISQACSLELSENCSPANYVEPNDRYSCLLGLIDEDKPLLPIREECKSNLFTLAFFVEQEYSLNHKLFKMCHNDAVKHCRAKPKYEKNDLSVAPQAVFHCLVRQWNRQFIESGKTLVSFQCGKEIKSVMKIEAGNFRLNFKIYIACSTDVIKFCKTVTHKMDCLQINYRNLTDHCKSSITNFLSLDAEEYSERKLIARSCGPMVRVFCAKEKEEKKKDYMACLIRHKFDKNMDKNCRITIENYQIIRLDNYKINHKFARFCSKEIQQFCNYLLPNSKQDENEEQEDGVTKRSQVSKSEIVSCLSKKLTLELIQNRRPFSSQCYEQFTFEFLQRSNYINFDPETQSICGADINKWCSKVESEGIISCLHRYQDSVSEECVNLLVSRQQLAAYDMSLDAGIQKYCKGMISSYCSKVQPHKVFRCLHKNMRIDGFNAECKAKVHIRLKRRLVDLRLNPELLDDCKQEIKMNCNITNVDDRISEMKFDDKYHIINCLRFVYVEHRKFLGALCRRSVFNIVLDAHSNVHLDPGLYEMCENEIKQSCSESLVENHVDTSGKVQDCLKHSLLEGKLQSGNCHKEVYRLLKEGRADVHVDPQLYSACRQEISKICHSERLGEGRKLSCLLWAFDDKNMLRTMSSECQSVLLSRKEMWELASKMEAPDNMKDVLILVSESHSRYYFLATILLLVMLILIIGAVCGRYMAQGNKRTRKRR